MELQGISAMAKTQTAYGKQSSEETDNSSGGWKYLTVRQGGRVYTYLVIGKNMRVLIGETAEKKTDGKDKESTDGKNNADGSAEQASGSADISVNRQSGGKEEKGIRPDFLLDASMLALTGYYQKKMRETIKHLGNSIGSDRNGNTAATANSGEGTKE